MKDDHFRIVMIPSDVSPEGRNLFLVFTEEEYQKAKRRGELVLKARNAKGEVDLNAILDECSPELS